MSAGAARGLSLSTLATYLRPVVTAALGESVVAVARRLRDRGVGCLVVTREGHPVGIVTDRDVALRVVAEGRDARTTRVDDIVTYDPVILRDADTIEAASTAMAEHGVRRLPIVDGAGLVIGIVTADDLVVALSGQLARLGATIEDPADTGDSR